ncbi:MAG: DUF3788 domain-containing protein [Lachnospiraceae bacterium]|nr:DUF3788 domain-containing protein [Lachnospiraceae bacterium]
MLEQIPTTEELKALLGDKGSQAWTSICAEIDKLYEMEHIWNSGGKAWKYEYKYRRGGKTLCALYAKQDCFGFMIIFGKDEREKVELLRDNLSLDSIAVYDSAKVYHDGKWVMFDESISLDDAKMFLAIKRKPNRMGEDEIKSLTL